MTTATHDRIRFRRPLPGSFPGGDTRRAARTQPDRAPIVVAVDGSRAASAAATEGAIRPARDLATPLVFRLRTAWAVPGPRRAQVKLCSERGHCAGQASPLRR